MEDNLRFQQIIGALSVPIATTTADGRIDLVNKQFLDYLSARRRRAMTISSTDVWSVERCLCLQH